MQRPFLSLIPSKHRCCEMTKDLPSQIRRVVCSYEKWLLRIGRVAKPTCRWQDRRPCTVGMCRHHVLTARGSGTVTIVQLASVHVVRTKFVDDDNPWNRGRSGLATEIFQALNMYMLSQTRRGNSSRCARRLNKSVCCCVLRDSSRL